MAAALAAVMIAAVPAAAQPGEDDRWRPDSLGMAADAVPLPVETLELGCRAIGLRVVRDSADARAIGRYRGCDPSRFPALGRDLYVHVVMGGDCHARFEVHAFESDARREYRVLMVKRYGGCRAGGFYQRWIRLPPLPPGWTVAFTERGIDEWR